MGRKLRHLPGEGHLVEVTCQVVQRRFLLRPSPQLNAIICGTLARFQKIHAMTICGFVYMSNHCHLLLKPTSIQQLANFMRDVNSKIAKEVDKLYDWKGGIFPRPYTDVTVSHEPEDQIGRLHYLLSQGTKEKLVASPKHWPGAGSTKALLSGSAIEGVWINRSEQYKAWERRELNPDHRFTTTHRLELSPIPCWEHLKPHQYQARVRAMVHEIEEAMEGVAVLGTAAILAQDPYGQPVSSPRRTPAPRYHAVQPQVRRALEWSYRLFRIAYRQAAEALQEGKQAEFPPGCFAPGRYMPLRS